MHRLDTSTFMENSKNLLPDTQTCLLSELLEKSHFTLAHLDIIKAAFKRFNKFSTVVISAEDNLVIYLTGLMLTHASKVNTNTSVQTCSYESWRMNIVESLEMETDRMRFARRTELSLLRRKSLDHDTYSFVVQKNRDDNRHCVYQFDFVKLDAEAKLLLSVQEEITKSLEHDKLTGGLNRFGVLNELNEKFQTITSSEQFSLVHFNIQNFRLINEQYGEALGDKVLISMYASIVYSPLHPVSYGRLGSDNFVCMVRNENLDYDAIHKLCHQEFDEDAFKIPFHSICGIYHIVDKNEAPVNAINRAKLAASYVQDTFIQPWMVFEPNMQKLYISDIEVLNSFEEAVANHEFVPFFQPIVDVQTGRIIMAEALVRWISPTKGMVSPGVFVPVLERHGGLSRIDMMMEQHVFDMQKQRLADNLPVVPIDLNLSWVDLNDKELLNQLYSHIKDKSLPTELISFEITESAMSSIAENRYDVLDFFKMNHVKLLIDDFGQSFSFGTMRDVDFAIIKIDKSMIDRIGSSRKANLLLEKFVSVFHELNAKVVAEGVETERQVEFLKQIGCDYIQGYYFYRPMPEKDFCELLAKEGTNEAETASLETLKTSAEETGEEGEKQSTKVSHRLKHFLLSMSSVKWEDLKSTLLIMTICAILSAVIYITTYHMVNNLVTESCDELTNRDIDKIKLHIDLELSSAQEALSAFSMAVFQNGLNIPESEEEIYLQMENFLNNTPMFSGIVAGFEDSVFPQYADKLGFGPLVRHQGDSLVRYQVGEIRDFRHSKEWYSEAFKQQKARWSAPFFSEEGDIIIDYCIPLFNQEKEVIGVVACDLSISHLRQVVENIKPFPTSLVMVMQEDLTFVIHPDTGYPMHKTLPVFLKERGIDADQELLESLRKGAVGKKIVNPLGEDLFLYYDVIDKAGYRLLIESSSNDVYSQLNGITKVMMNIGFVGLIVLIFTLGYMINDNKKRERRQVERNMRILRHMAETDGLTGIYNRSTGEGLISEAISKHKPGVLAILDCDKFKDVNDNFGHANGDFLLKQLAATMKECFPDDITLRLGGDEFAIFCRGIRSHKEFEDRVQYFFNAVRTIRLQGVDDYIPSISMGAAVYDGDPTINFDQLYKIADHLLYSSKKQSGCTLSITDNRSDA